MVQWSILTLVTNCITMEHSHTGNCITMQHSHTGNSTTVELSHTGNCITGNILTLQLHLQSLNGSSDQVSPNTKHKVTEALGDGKGVFVGWGGRWGGGLGGGGPYCVEFPVP